MKINFEKSNDLLSSLKADNDTIYMKVKLTFAYFLKNRQISFSFLACLLKNHKKNSMLPLKHILTRTFQVLCPKKHLSISCPFKNNYFLILLVLKKNHVSAGLQLGNWSRDDLFNDVHARQYILRIHCKVSSYFTSIFVINILLSLMDFYSFILFSKNSNYKELPLHPLFNHDFIS